MLRCKLKPDTRQERKKLIRGKPPVLHLVNVSKNRQTFEKGLSNRCSTLEKLEDKEDINSRNRILTEIIRETAKEIASIEKKNREQNLRRN